MGMSQISQSFKSRIEFVSGVNGTTLTSGVTSVTFSGHQTGDFLLAMGASQQTADPTVTGGWTKICSYTATGTIRVGILVYKYATSTASDTVTFTGTGTSTAQYSSGFIFRYVRGIGNFNTVTNTGSLGSSIPSPSLTLSDTTTGISALVLASYVGNMTAAPNSMTVSNGMAYGLLRNSWAGGNFTIATTNLFNCGIVELLN